MTKVPGVIVEVNGAEIYHEVRGAGPTLLFISGSTSDAGHFEQVANELQDEFTVVTDDRRGNSRSPRPDGWDGTSVDEQADDAAGLIEALDGAPARVWQQYRRDHRTEPPDSPSSACARRHAP